LNRHNLDDLAEIVGMKLFKLVLAFDILDCVFGLGQAQFLQLCFLKVEEVEIRVDDDGFNDVPLVSQTIFLRSLDAIQCQLEQNVTWQPVEDLDHIRLAVGEFEFAKFIQVEIKVAFFATEEIAGGQGDGLQVRHEVEQVETFGADILFMNDEFGDVHSDASKHLLQSNAVQSTVIVVSSNPDRIYLSLGLPHALVLHQIVELRIFDGHLEASVSNVAADVVETFAHHSNTQLIGNSPDYHFKNFIWQVENVRLNENIRRK
jgi:hypothetical protein